MAGQRANQSNPFSTGGGGVNFEVYVQTYIAMHIVTGDSLPFLNSSKPVKMKLQGHYAGYDTDDCIVFGENGEKVLCQIKHTITVSENDSAFPAVITDAWNDYYKPEVFNQETDRIILIVPGLHGTDRNNTKVFLEWARCCENADEFMTKMTTEGFSSKEKQKKYNAIKNLIQSANGARVSDSEIWNFLRHFSIQALELDHADSPLFAAVANSFSKSVGKNGLEDKLYRYIADYNQNAGTITQEQLVRELHLEIDMLDDRGAAIHEIKARLLQQKREHPSFRLLANNNSEKADTELFPMAIQLTERYMTYHDEYDVESEPIKLSEFIAESWKKGIYRHLQIQGVGGIGKTVTLLSITTEPGFLPHEVPAVYIPLYELNGYTEDKGIEAYLRRNYPKTYEMIAYLSAEPWRDGPNLILLLDGFNEIVLKDRRERIWSEIREWAGNSGVQIITSSRSYSGFTEDKFVPITLQKLKEEQVISYLQKYNNEHDRKVEIPLKGDRLLSVLNIPLMLTLYLQVEGISEERKAYPFLEFRDYISAGNLIRNFIQKEILNYSEYVRNIDVGLYVFSLTAVLPYIMYQMEQKGLYAVSEDDVHTLIKEAISYYENSAMCVPQQVAKARRGRRIDFNDVDETVIYSNLVEKSSIMVLTTGCDNIDMLRPMHQDFRDGLAALFLCNCGLGYCTVKNIMPEEYTIPQRYYVIRFMSEMLTRDEASKLWEMNRVYVPTNNVCCRLLMEIIGMMSGYDYIDIDFSGMDLTKVSLYSYLDFKPGLPRYKEVFKNTRLSEKTFIPVGHTGGVNCITVNSEGNRLISGSYDKTLRVWDIENDECLYKLEGHKGAIKTVALCSDCDIVVSGSDDGTVKLWNYERGKFIRDFIGHGGSVRTVAISRDGEIVLSGSSDYTVRVWNVKERDSIYKFDKHGSNVTTVSMYENKNIVVSGDESGIVHVWNYKEKKSIQQFECGDQPQNGRIIGAYIIRDGMYMISGTSKGCIQIWEVNSGRLVKEVSHKITGSLSCMSVSPDEKYIALGSYHWNSYLVDIENNLCKQRFERHTDRISAVSYCKDGKRLITASWDKTIRIWDLYTGECVQTLGRQTNCVASISMSLDGQHVAIGFRNGAVSLWNVRTGVCENYIRQDRGTILSVSIDEHGKYIASGSWNGQVGVWNSDIGEYIAFDYKQAHGNGLPINSVGAVSISANGFYVLSGNRDGAVCLWETQTGNLIKSFKKHNNKPELFMTYRACP